MSKPRPGIFDPWRQEAPSEQKVVEPKGALRIADALDPTEEQERRCVSFRGGHADINVWVFAELEDANRVAVKELVELIYEMWPTYSSSFESVGIHQKKPTTPGKLAHSTCLRVDDKAVWITTAAGTDAQAIELLSIVLREAPPELLSKHGVKPAIH